MRLWKASDEPPANLGEPYKPDFAALAERMREVNYVPVGPPPLSPEAQVTIERAQEFNRTRSAVLRARECHKRAVRQAEELTSTALTVLEDAEEHYRDAALALRRVSSS